MEAHPDVNEIKIGNLSVCVAHSVFSERPVHGGEETLPLHLALRAAELAIEIEGAFRGPQCGVDATASNGANSKAFVLSGGEDESLAKAHVQAVLMLLSGAARDADGSLALEVAVARAENDLMTRAGNGTLQIGQIALNGLDNVALARSLRHCAWRCAKNAGMAQALEKLNRSCLDAQQQPNSGVMQGLSALTADDAYDMGMAILARMPSHSIKIPTLSLICIAALESYALLISRLFQVLDYTHS